MWEIKEKGSATYEVVNVLVGATIIETKDETRDRGTFVIARSTRRIGYKPYSLIRYTDNDNNVFIFTLLQDSVIMLNRGNATRYYRHSITYSQSTSNLQYHILRNMNISQNIDIFYNSGNYYTMCVKSQSGMYATLKNNVGLNSEYVGSIGQMIASPKVLGKTNTFTIPSDYLIIKPRIVVNNGFFSNAHETTSLGGVDFSTRIGYPDNMRFDNNSNAIQIYINGKLVRNTLHNSDYFYNGEYIDLENCYIYVNGSLVNMKTMGWVSYNLVWQSIQNVDEVEQWSFPSPYSADAILDIKSFSNLIITYQKYKYSLYDTLVKIRNICPLAFHDSNFESSRLFTISQHLKKLSEKVPSPQFNFSNSTLYDALFECLKVLDGVPYINENGELDIEFFNDLAEEESKANITTYQSTFSSKDYVNRFIAELQNSQPTKSVVYPSEHSWFKLTTPTSAVPDKNLCQATLPNNLERIENFYLLANIGGSEVLAPIDISCQCITSEVYNALNYVDTEPYLVYSQGTNAINMGETYQHAYFSFITTFKLDSVVAKAYEKTNPCGVKNIGLDTIPTIESDFTKIYYQIHYISQDNARVQIVSPQNKQEGEILTNQSNGIVNIERVGRSMLGLIAKSGNEEIAIKKRFTNFNNRIKKGNYYIYDNEIYVANVVNTTFHRNGIIESSAQLTRNFNKISNRTQIDIQKRLSLISSSLGTNAEDFYTDYYIASETHGKGDLKQCFTKTFSDIFTAMFDTTAITYRFENNSQPELVAFTYLDPSTSPQKVYIPLQKLAIGNSLQYRMFYKDKIVANYSIVSQGGASVCKPIPYTKSDGTLDEVYLDIWGRKKPLSAKEYDLESANSGTPYVNSSYFNSTYFNHFIDIARANGSGGYNGLYFLKDNNESLAINYCVSVVSDNSDKIVIGSEMMNANWLYTSQPSFNIVKVSSSTDLVNFEESDFTNFNDSATISVSVNSDSSFNMLIDLPSGTKSVAIYNKDNNRLIFGYNNLDNFVGTKIIYFTPSHERF